MITLKTSLSLRLLKDPAYKDTPELELEDDLDETIPAIVSKLCVYGDCAPTECSHGKLMRSKAIGW